MIVVHYTAGSTLEGAFDTFAPETLGGRPELEGAGTVNVGIQFVVDYDGAIYQIQPDNYFARHCIGLNHSAIGIENIGRRDISETALQGGISVDDELTTEQLHSNAHLIRYLKFKYPKIQVLIGHSEYRELEDPSHPGHAFFYESDPDYRTEKSDPGPNFMRALRKELTDLSRPERAGRCSNDLYKPECRHPRSTTASLCTKTERKSAALKKRPVNRPSGGSPDRRACLDVAKTGRKHPALEKRPVNRPSDGSPDRRACLDVAKTGRKHPALEKRPVNRPSDVSPDRRALPGCG